MAERSRALRWLSTIWRWGRNLLAVVGLFSLIGGGYVALKIYRSNFLTPQQFAIKVAHKLGINSPLVERLLAPAPGFPDYKLQGRFQNNIYPRLLFPGPAGFEPLRRRYRSDPAYKSTVDNLGKQSQPISRAVAWVCSGERYFQEAGLSALRSANPTSPGAEDNQFGNGWQLALAYDLLRTTRHELLPEFELRLQGYLRELLVILDGEGVSLWHTRFSLASCAWIAATVLDQDSAAAPDLIRRAQAHFLEAVAAIEVAEGWPEGYTYWINNRAFVYALAVAGHLHAIDAPQLNARVRRTLERAGEWMLHGTEPYGRFVLFGDTGPRNDLQYDTQRVIDLIYLVTGQPLYRHYSEYLSTLFTTETYDRPLRWGIPLLQGAARAAGMTRRPDLTFLAGGQPLAALFGKDGLGQVFLRSDWGQDATFVFYQAGHSMTHHGHYKAGHFTLAKREPLAISSGTYGDYFAPHRLNYYLRTVAANSLLILRPGEKVQPNKFFDVNIADGGQRIVMPTGSAVKSVDDWRANLGKGRHYEGGKIEAFENRELFYTYVASDLTDAYNNIRYDDNFRGGKVSLVTRELLYLRAEDALLIYDRVVATDGAFVKKWLLHSLRKPVSANEKILVGQSDNGILETSDELLTIPGNSTLLTVRKFLPLGGVARKIGGPDYRYYVEADGDELSFDGINMALGSNERPWYDAGMWRLELQPKPGSKSDTFLVLLKPGAGTVDFVRRARLVDATTGEGLETDDTLALFAKEGRAASYDYQASPGKRRHILTGLAPNTAFKVVHAQQRLEVSSSDGGVLSFDLMVERSGPVSVQPASGPG